MDSVQRRAVGDVRPEPEPAERRAIELAVAATAREQAASTSGRGRWWHVGVRENVADPAPDPG